MNKEATLGGTVRDRRLALGYSLGQLATKVNKTAASIRSWERGDTVPSEDETVALSDALDLDGELLASLRDAARTAIEPAAVEPAAVEPADVEPAAVEPAAVEPADAAVDDPWESATAAAEVVEPSPGGESSAEVAMAATAESVGAEDAADEEPAEEPVDRAAPTDGATEAIEELTPPAVPVEEHADIDSATEGGEALVDTVAALAAAGFTDDDEAAEPPGVPPEAPAATGAQTATVSGMHEAMTEAVPVVPAGAVAVTSASGTADMSTVAAEPYSPPSSVNPVVQAWDNVVATYHRIFDPQRLWIYRVRWVLLLIAFYIMLRVLAWAGGELWDAIGEVLDGIAFTPSETPDVSN